ncbi:MAG: hypothetical protein E4H15_05055 [Syntrophobacterales bacterium]|nr:MAG: hypothetical protein E4H15_05055 [Syntrophobacterales bacterium]
MHPKDLVKIWGAPDNTRLTPKQISIRLPIHVAAKISAISDMYPKKTKTEIIGDLLAAALAQFAEGLSNEPNEYEEVQGKDPLMEWCGARGVFEGHVKKYLDEFDMEETGTEEK